MQQLLYFFDATRPIIMGLFKIDDRNFVGCFMYGYSVVHLNILSALEASADSQWCAYGLARDHPRVLSPCDARNVITAAVSAIDRQHKIADFSAQWGFSQGGGLAECAAQKNVVAFLAMLFDQIPCKQADDQLGAAVVFVVEGAQLPEYVYSVIFLQCKAVEQLFADDHVQYIICPRKPLYTNHGLIKSFSAILVGQLRKMQKRSRNFCIIVVDCFVHSSPPCWAVSDEYGPASSYSNSFRDMRCAT